MKGFDRTPQQTPDSAEKAEGQTRREFFKIAAAVVVGFSLAKLSDLINENPEDLRYKVLQERLLQARSELPEGVPISLSITEDGEIIYQHEDAITTEFINYLSGRGELTEAVVAASLRRDMFAILKSRGDDVTTKDVRDFLYVINTEIEITKFYIDNFDFFSEEMKEKWQNNPESLAKFRIAQAREVQERFLADITPEFYGALWKMYIHAGASPLRIVDTYDERPKHKNHVAGSAHSFVPNKENPYINIDFTGGYKSLLAGFLVESAHMNSYTNDREGYTARSEHQKKVIGSLEGLSPEEVSERRKIAYITKGTVENHDHTIGLETISASLIPYNPVVLKILEDEKAELQSYRTAIE